MNADEIEACHQERREVAESIKSHTKKYKVCQGCRSIMYRRSSICPICKAYRFDTSRKSIEAAANDAARHVFPATLGYAPPTRRDYEFYPYAPAKLPVKPVAVG